MKLFSNNLWKRNNLFLFLAFMIAPMLNSATHMVVPDDGGGGSEHEMTEKEKAEKVALDLTKKLDEKFKVLDDYAKKTDLQKLDLTPEELTTLKADIQKIIGKNTELVDITVAQGKEINKLKEVGMIVQTKKQPETRRGLVKSILDNMFFKGEIDEDGKALPSEIMEKAINSNFNGAFMEKSSKDLQEKTVIGVGTDHAGTIFITDPRMEVRDTPLRQVHIRDLLARETTDGAQITAPEVYDYTDAFTAGAIMLGENTEAPEVQFKTKENTWTLKRIAVSMRISKRYFKTNGLMWVRDHVLNRLPDQIQFVEDFQLLFGDGSGNNVDGLYKDAQSFDLTPSTYTAGAFSSVATWNSAAQALVTFAAVHNLKNGDNVTIANASESTYNATHTSVIVVNAFQIIINVAYVVEADTSAWSGTGTSYWYQSIDNAQEFDVLSCAVSLLQSGEYFPTGIVLHPNDVQKLGLIKGTDAHYVGVSRDAMGRLNINALPIATTTAVPAGQFFLGDFQRAAALAEYTPLNIQLAEDVDTKKKNEVVIIAEEEIIFPKYNPFWFMYGYFAAAKTELETPAS